MPRRFEYVLTAKGRDLHPVLQAYCRWANKHIPGTLVPPAAFMRKTRA
ncbi:winged helix-turn-helix transcriptional regulator [uncultured Boseongicola sp.]